jgi:hypothetical protein
LAKIKYFFCKWIYQEKSGMSFLKRNAAKDVNLPYVGYQLSGQDWNCEFAAKSGVEHFGK